MKAIIINPELKTTATAIIGDANESLSGLYRTIGCNLVEIVRLGPVNGIEQVAVIDEEGMLRDEQFFTQLGDVPLAGTLVMLSEVIGPEGAIFASTELDERYVRELFERGYFRWIDASEARKAVADQQHEAAERYRAAGYEVTMTSDYGFVATEPAKKEEGGKQ